MSTNPLRKVTLSLIMLLAYANNAESCDTTDPLLIETFNGCIRGKSTDLGDEWLSIPYATPPTLANDLRWKDPIPPSNWTEILDATNIPPSCMQNCKETSFGGECYLTENVTETEDCLYLNVYAPANSSDDSLAVMFFIHGGSYLHGWSGDKLYDGAAIANMNDVIVVTINYRMGVLGFLYDSDLGYTGNFGYNDQLLALKWVNQNIENFGGDPEKVVIFGESAGAMSVGTILLDTSDEVTSLYSGAIMESNPLGLAFRTIDSWDTLPSKFYEEAGCSSDTAECLSGKSSAAILAAQHAADSSLLDNCYHWKCYWLHKGAPWTPTFQTGDLPQVQPLSAFASGDFNKDVPIIIGTNKNEAVPFIYGFLEGVFGSYDQGLCGIIYDLMLYAVFGYEDGQKIKEHFKEDQPDCFAGDYRELMSKVTTQFLFTCGTRKAVESISKHSNKNVYLYNYNHLYSDSSSIFYDSEVCTKESLDNVCHGDELPLIFQPEGMSFTDKERDLSDLIQAYWTSVAKNGDPTDSVTNIEWSPFTEDAQYEMVFDEDGSAQVLNYANDNYDCEFWDELDYSWIYEQTAQCGDHCWSDEDRRRLLDLPDFCTSCDDEEDHAAALNSCVAVVCTIFFVLQYYFM